MPDFPSKQMIEKYSLVLTKEPCLCQYESGDRKCTKLAFVDRNGKFLCFRHYKIETDGIEYVKRMEPFDRRLRL